MCGICGWFNRKKDIDLDVLISMNNVAKHRGPDDEGYSLMTETGVRHFVGEDSISLPYENLNKYDGDRPGLAFGHRRLSIIDLSEQGHQPMQSEDGNLCITYNGEIYNYIEIREELERSGYAFKSNSDTEVILAAYRQWGEECVLHLNGMWGFAIWDKKENKIFCSRDRLGAKPFHYYVDENNFIFGSEMKQLTVNPVVPRVINEKILVSFMIWSQYDYSEETLIRDINALRGGYNLSCSLPQTLNGNIGIKIYKYWDIDVVCEKNPSVIEQAFRIHNDAVRIRLRSDVPIGVMLSGGLDSSVLTSEISVMARENHIDPASINTYTSCYKDYPEGDEKAFAEKVNAYCGTRQNLVYPDEMDTFSVFEDMIWHMEGLVEFYSMGGFLTLREVAKSGNKVIINGQGADETMFGYLRYYTWYLKDIRQKKGIAAFIRELRKAVNNGGLSGKELLQNIIYFGNMKIRRTYCRNRMKKYVTGSVLKEFDSNKEIEKYMHFDSLAEMQYNEIRGTQLTHILRMDDRNYMAFSMESRVPFIDYRYIESAVQIPEERKIDKGYTKFLLRQYIDGKLPEDVVWRKNKMGWPSPRSRWIKRLDKARVEKLLDNPRSKKYFRIDKVKKLWQKNPEAVPFEKFLSVELFMRLFDVEAN